MSGTSHRSHHLLRQKATACPHPAPLLILCSKIRIAQEESQRSNHTGEISVRTVTASFCLLSSLICSVAMADGPFEGTWHLNTAKSHLTGDTMKFEEAGDGSLKFTDSDESYSFKTDGSTFTTPLGTERTFKKNSDGTYTSTNKRNGVPLSTSSWTISADGKNLVIDSKGTKPNGEVFENVSNYVRTSAGDIVGDWKSTKVKLSAPNTLGIESSGENVTLTISGIKATCQAKWDGKEYAPTAPTVPQGLTLSVTKTGADSFKLVQKFKGKVLATIRYTVAADGKSMVAKGVNGQGKEPFTELWEKQPG
jgi:hypothetical protein